MALDRAIQLAHRRRRGAADAAALRVGAPDRHARALPGCRRASTATSARAHGIDVVRRYTGGRGVLHDDEVTYSVVAGIGDGVPRGTSASYRLLCGGLAEAYRLLGVDAALTPRRAASGDSAACYLHATQADLSLGAAKALGFGAGVAGRHGPAARLVHHLAGRRHGGIGVSPDRSRARAPRRGDGDARRRARRAARREQLVRDCVAAGFADALGVELVAGRALGRASRRSRARLRGETLASRLPRAMSRLAGSR